MKITFLILNKKASEKAAQALGQALADLGKSLAKPTEAEGWPRKMFIFKKVLV